MQFSDKYMIIPNPLFHVKVCDYGKLTNTTVCHTSSISHKILKLFWKEPHRTKCAHKPISITSNPICKWIFHIYVLVVRMCFITIHLLSQLVVF